MLLNGDLEGLNLTFDDLLSYLLEMALPATLLPSSLTFNYKVVEGYESTDGKFSNAVGNTAIVDCHYLLDGLGAGLMEGFRNAISN